MFRQHTFTPALAQLIDAFQSLPGIGPKSAQRMAFHMLKKSMPDVEHFAQAVRHAKATIGECTQCFNWSETSPCEICANPNRSPREICVVADTEDLYALERTGAFHHQYHVLHGLISPMDGVGPDELRIRELIARCGSEPPPEEVILALPPSIEGDTTSLYLTKLLGPLGIKTTRIAFGLPVGGDLDYADQLTITRALEGRREISAAS